MIAASNQIMSQSSLFLSSSIGVETMFNWLYDVPEFWIELVSGIACAGLFAGAPFLREKTLRIRVTAHSVAIDNALFVVVSFTGVVLAFSLVQATINFRNLDTQVGTEAHDITQLDRLIFRYGDPANGVIRTALRDYANSIVVDEWPELRKGRSSARTAGLFRPISRGILAIDPPAGRQSLIYAEMLKKVDEIAADRKARVVAAAKTELPLIYWETIMALLAILVLLAAFSEATFVRAVALGAQGFGLALLVALVYIVDEPFKGGTSISPEPIVTVIAEMQARSD
jgi:Protein of unknown function (DUF4239)